MPSQSKCQSQSLTFMSNGDPVCNGVDTESESKSDRTATLHSPTSRKEKTASIFSFLQRFRVKNKNILDVTSLPPSPHSVRRRPQKSRNRWESAESILSTATASSFAFIPPIQVRGGPRLLHPSTVPAQTTTEVKPSLGVPGRDNTVFLRRKYNLLGSDASLCPNERKCSLKNLYRNSVGNVENIKPDEEWRDESVFSSFRRPAKPVGLTQRPKSEYSISSEYGKSGRVYCHKPGKGRAPPPPVIRTCSSKFPLTKSVSRKKRKAPSPPRSTNTDAKMEIMNNTSEEKVAEKIEEEPIVYNDSLKLEKGQLKANNRTFSMNSTKSSISSDPSIPVSPKPWYKRTSVRNSKKMSSKKKSPEELLDEWMLEAGLPRSTFFCNDRDRKIVVADPEEHKIVPAVVVDPASSKRKSQISILANISELDREAAEIVRKERRKEHEMAASFHNRFYDPSPCGRSTSWNKYTSSKDINTSTKRHTSKDLISIINAITNVTKITVNANIFKDSLVRPVSKQDLKSELAADGSGMSSELIITEVNDTHTDKETRISQSERKNEATENSKPLRNSLQKSASPVTKEAPKPVKPFSSWVCPQCTLENPSWKFICEACNKWRPYSVNKIHGRNTPLVSPTEDAKLPQTEKHDRDSLIKERDEIKKISESIRKQVFDILTAGEHVRNNLFRLQKSKSVTSNECEIVRQEKINSDVEETRRARLAFFSKNCLNDLNRDGGALKNILPNGERTKNKYYNEEDRRKLRKILKELNDSLPKINLSERGGLVKQNSESAIRKTEKEQFNNLKEKLELSVSKNIPPATLEPIYSVPVKKSQRKSKCEVKHQDVPTAEIQLTQSRADEKKITTKGISDDVNLEKTDSNKMLPDSKGNVSPSGSNPKENCKLSVNLTVNRLLNKLQTAIASGQHHEAANIARELARLKVNCNMTHQETPDPSSKIVNVSVNLHIRRDAIQLVPIPLKLNANLTINELKKRVSQEYDISSEKQVWMVRGKLIEDESATLEQLAANTSEILDVYLYSSFDNGNSSSTIQNGVVLDEQKPSTSTGTNDAMRDNATKEAKLAIRSDKIPTSLKFLNDSSVNLESNRDIDSEAGSTSSALTIQKNTSAKIDVKCPNKLQNAQIISKAEENMKLKKKGTAPLPSKIKSKAVTITYEIEVSKVKIDEPNKPQESIRTGSKERNHSNVLENVSRSIEIEPNELKKSVQISTSEENKSNGIENASVSIENEPAVESGTTNFVSTFKIDVVSTDTSLSDENPTGSKEWKCLRCTLINPIEERYCAACGNKMLDTCSSTGNEAGHLPKLERSKVVEIDKLANYKELVDMEKSDIIPNVEKFECSVCLVEYGPGDGVILKDCLHIFCKNCLAQTVRHSSEAEVKCPFNDNYSCESVLQEREIKALVTPEVYEQHLARSVKEAENKIQNTFHCKTPNCHGWCIYEDNVNEFLCPVCDKTNCLTCQVIHTGLNCKQYQEIINQESETNADANRTRLMLLEMLEKKEAMTCPTCQVIVMKKWGCDWLRCSMCKTEICWVTRGPRWGPKGKGDTSAGCRCGMKGIKCHPRCSYCH